MPIRLLSLTMQLRRWVPIMFVLLLVALMLHEGWPSTFERGDCVWARSAQAWVDQNRNGTWDNAEPPLPGVRFFVDDVRNELADVAQDSLSDDRGVAVLRVLLPDCGNTRFEIYAEPPEPYAATTSVRVAGRGNGPFNFGFAPGTPVGGEPGFSRGLAAVARGLRVGMQ